MAREGAVRSTRGASVMSILGTSVAAAVAQTALQAQQVARQRESVPNQTTRDARRIQDLIEAHLLALEEDDQLDSTDQLRINGRLPQHQSSNQQKQNAHGQTAAKPIKDEVTQAAAPNAAPALGDQLYRHLDVQA